VGENGEQLGVVTVAFALDAARKRGLDLIEVAPTAVPPVCRLMDYGKFKYDQAKKDREIRKGQKPTEVREIRLRPKIGDHDFDAKARSAIKLLEGGSKVKVAVMFRGRESTHPELGWKLIQRMAEQLKDNATVDKQAGMENPRTLSVVLSPLNTPKPKPTSAKTEEPKVTEEVKESINAKA